MATGGNVGGGSIGSGAGIGGPPSMLGRTAGGFNARGVHHHGGFIGGGAGPGAMRMDKIHQHRFNPIGMSGGIGGAAGGTGGGYAQPHFW